MTDGSLALNEMTHPLAFSTNAPATIHLEADQPAMEACTEQTSNQAPDVVVSGTGVMARS